MGSSEAVGGQVSSADRFETLVERQLTEKLKSKCSTIEVLNFGVPGYTLAQEYLTLRDDVWAFHPHIVILATSSAAMIRNTRKLNPGAKSSTPFFVLDHGELVLDSVTRSTPPLNPEAVAQRNRLSDWMNRSEILSMMNEALRVRGPEIIAAIKSRFGRNAHAANKPLPLVEQVANWAYLPDLPQVRESWLIADALLKAMKEDCDRHGAEFRLVVIGTDGAVDPNVQFRASLARRLGVPDLQASDRRLADLAASHGIPALTLAPAMASYAACHQVALHGFQGINVGHWNAVGHHVAARLITDDLLHSSRTIADLQPGCVPSGN